MTVEELISELTTRTDIPEGTRVVFRCNQGHTFYAIDNVHLVVFADTQEDEFVVVLARTG